MICCLQRSDPGGADLQQLQYEDVDVVRIPQNVEIPIDVGFTP
jgi:hypothetical protein